MIAEILCVGTELLMGQVLNTNAQFISRRLAALGITQHHQTVVGDNAGRLEEAYRLALSRADVVITSGGLGPTVDDITKRAAARVIGRDLVPFPEAEAMVRERFRQYGKEMLPNNLSQTMFTPDSRLILKPYGTAPGAIVPAGEGKFIVHLPGPPRELEPLFLEQVEPWLASLSERVLRSRYIRIFGMGEAMVDEKCHDLEEGGNPSLSPYCSTGEVTLRLTASADTAEEAMALIAPVEREVCRRLGDAVWAVEDDDSGSLARACVDALRRAGLTISLSEGPTQGAVVAALAAVPGAEDVISGGAVHPREEADDAPRKAELARVWSRADLGLAVGGTGPEILIALTDGGEPRLLPLRLSGDPARVRTLAAKHAVHLLLKEARARAAGSASCRPQ